MGQICNLPNLMQRKHVRRRRGIATLEFAMCLPILLFLIVGIVWLGFAVAAQNDVTVQARNAAWRLRHGGSAENPGKGPAPGERPLFFVHSNFIDETAQTSVQISPLFDSFAQPESSHRVMGGSWSHAVVDLNEPPSWQLYAQVAASGQAAGLQSGLSDIESGMGKLFEQGSELLNALDLGEEIQNLFTDFTNIF